MKRRLDGAQREFDAALGTRRRALERPLQEIDALRRRRDVDSLMDVPGDHTMGADGDDLAASAV